MSTLDYTEIGKNIRAQRVRKGLTQKQLAELIHISPQHISHIETGRTAVSLPTLVDIANVLDTDVNALLGNNLTKQRKSVLRAELAKVLDACSSEVLERTLEFCYTESEFVKKLTERLGKEATDYF